jgi:hypothetical protein
MKTIAEFVEACKTLNSDEIYELFEWQISPKLRDEIYATSTETSSPEPVRLRLNALGMKYNVRSLQDY